jgi:hypothetical protein
MRAAVCRVSFLTAPRRFSQHRRWFSESAVRHAGPVSETYRGLKVAACVTVPSACLIGAYLWRHEWCESKFQELALIDPEERSHVSLHQYPNHVSHLVSTRKKDVEVFKQLLSDRPASILHVEAATEVISECFVNTAMATRPCVVYLNLKVHHVDSPDGFLKHLARTFGVYWVNAFLQAREFLFRPPLTYDAAITA